MTTANQLVDDANAGVIRDGARIEWYRVPIAKERLRALTQRSDLKGWLQTGAFLGMLAVTGGMAFLAWGRLPWPAVAALVFVHGTFWPFLLNGFHELCHRTVFRSRGLNIFWGHAFSLLSWHNVYWFTGSHMRHHQYTLHPPGDLEVVLPIRLTLRDFLRSAVISPGALRVPIGHAVRLAAGRLEGEWEHRCFPESDPALRRRLFTWARVTLTFHVALTAVSIGFGLWAIPVLVSLTPLYGGWLLFLLNNTQHVGLMNRVPDFRLCCRTIHINPFFRFIYWHMNYHTEHHMYAAVPCYNLHRLHAEIRHAMPPCPRGIVATWRHIADIQRRQKADATYQFRASLPPDDVG